MRTTDRRRFLQMGSASLLATVRLNADTTYNAVRLKAPPSQGVGEPRRSPSDQRSSGGADTNLAGVRALTFDTFGTVVDYRSTIIAEGEALGKAKGLKVDWPRFADAWRSGYAPAMNRVRSGELPWTKLDALHRMTLDRLLREFNIAGLSEPEIDRLNHVWHRLKPWPDSVSGLTRLKKKYVIAPLSNGNLALLTNMAKHAGLPWDCILGAELARHYKPDKETYLTAAELLDLKPSEIMMVAAHQADLGAAHALGFRTGFVPRPKEGPNGEKNLTPDPRWDVVAADFNALAGKLGA
jgi:2-haloacid dehalogenase